MSTLRLLIVDDHQVVRLGLHAILDSEPDMTVVGEAGTATDAVRLAGQLQPDIVLMDVRLPDRLGTHACQEIRQQWPQMQVLMLTSYADEELVLDAINAGAAGYLLKQLNADGLVDTLRAVAHGDAVLDPAVTRLVLSRVRRAERESHLVAFSELSMREIEVLALVAEGKTNGQIAEQLMLSEKTVGNHVSTILSKLELTNRIEAATYAVRHHIEQCLGN